MGGYVALSLVARYPKRVRALMLMDTRAARRHARGGRGRARRRRRPCSAGERPRPVVEAMIARLFAKMTLEERPERVEPMRERHGAERRPGASPAPCAAWPARPDRRGDLAKIAVPTLVMVGEEDVITPPAEAQDLAEAIPSAGSR